MSKDKPWKERYPDKPMDKKYYEWLRGRKLYHEVNITKDEWVQWWTDTGVFDQRGRHKDQYCMARIDRSKPFQLDNIALRLRKER